MTEPAEEERPNVILICVDQWRGDCLSCAGHPVVHTPSLDALAADGVRFARAYSATPSCIPARVALFTGLSQRGHGRFGYRDGIPWDYPVTLAGEFTRHGCQTQAIGKMHVYPERSQVGFQNVILHDGYLHFARKRDRDIGLVDDYIPWLRQQTGNPSADYFDHGVNCNSYVARPWDKPEHLHPTNWVITQGIDFLRRRDPRKPFFLYLSFHRPHPPYDPPAWAFEQYLDAPMPDPPVGDWVEILEPYRQPGRPDASVDVIPERLLRRARAGYYGHITHIDQQVNRFLEVLGEYGLAQNSWIAFVSDHGEMMGDHHLFRKTTGYEGSARVPFILKGPSGAGLPRGAVVREVLELRDVMPTLLDCARLPVPESVEGISALPLARAEKAVWREYLHGEHTTFGQSLHWLTDGREKYLWWSGTGREQLFDVQSDPQERRDLAQSAPGRAERWREILLRELSGRPEASLLERQGSEPCPRDGGK